MYSPFFPTQIFLSVMPFQSYSMVSDPIRQLTEHHSHRISLEKIFEVVRQDYRNPPHLHRLGLEYDHTCAYPVCTHLLGPHFGVWKETHTSAGRMCKPHPDNVLAEFRTNHTCAGISGNYGATVLLRIFCRHFSLYFAFSLLSIAYSSM